MPIYRQPPRPQQRRRYKQGPKLWIASVSDSASFVGDSVARLKTFHRVVVNNPPGSSPGFVRANTGLGPTTLGVTQSTIVPTYTACATGNTLVAIVFATQVNAGMTTSGTANWTQVGSTQALNSALEGQYLYVSFFQNATVDGSTSATFTYSLNCTPFAIVYEFSGTTGIDAATIFTATQTSNGNFATTGTGTADEANDWQLIGGILGDGTVTPNAISGFTNDLALGDNLVGGSSFGGVAATYHATSVNSSATIAAQTITWSGLGGWSLGFTLLLRPSAGVVITDRLSFIRAGGRSVTNSNITSDAFSRLVSYRRPFTNSNTLTGTVTAVKAKLRSASNTNALVSDLLHRVLAAPRARSNTNAFVSDALSNIKLKARFVTNTQSNAGTIARIKSINRAIANVNALGSDQIRVGGSFSNRAVTNSNTQSQVIDFLKEQLRFGSNNQVGSDAIAQTYHSTRSIVNSDIASDAVLRRHITLRTVLNSSTMSDAAVQLKLKVKSVANVNAFINDTLTRHQTLTRVAANASAFISDVGTFIHLSQFPEFQFRIIMNTAWRFPVNVPVTFPNAVIVPTIIPLITTY